MLLRGLTFVVLAAVVFVIAGTAFLWWSGALGTGMSRIEDRIDVPSPDAQYIVSGYHVAGSAVVHNSTIFTLRSQSSPSEETPILIVDMRVPKNPFNVRWTDKKHLSVTYTPGDIYLQKPSWKDVQISYTEK